MRVQDSPFDARHYGVRVAHLHADVEDDADELDRAVAEARTRELDVLFLRLPDAHGLCGVLARRGQPSIDTLVTSSLGTTRPPLRVSRDVTIEHHARLEAASDLDAVATITAETIRRSHLHADPRLPLERTRRLYAEWARNDVTGRAQRTIIARSGGALVGYIAVLERGRRAIIDLVAVDAATQGRGIGSALLASFVEWIGDRDVIATVGTQADNPALALYKRAGFVATETHFSYHLWLSELPR